MKRKRLMITMLVAVLVGVTALTGVVAMGSDDSAGRGHACPNYPGGICPLVL